MKIIETQKMGGCLVRVEGSQRYLHRDDSGKWTSQDRRGKWVSVDHLKDELDQALFVYEGEARKAKAIETANRRRVWWCDAYHWWTREYTRTGDKHASDMREDMTNRMIAEEDEEFRLKAMPASMFL